MLEKLKFPIFLIFGCLAIVIFAQHGLALFEDLFDNLSKFVEKKISAEVWPLVLTVKVLIIPTIITAMTIRTFCRYIHDSRRSISRTHFKSTIIYILSILVICALFSIFAYCLLAYSGDKSLLLSTKKELTVSESKYLINLMFIFTLFINSITYMISTYFIESIEMRRINKINDMGALMLDSSYISYNMALLVIISLVYLISMAIYGNHFFNYLQTIQLIAQPFVYIMIFASFAHFLFAGFYMKYTNIPIGFATIIGEEKNEQ